MDHPRRLPGAVLAAAAAILVALSRWSAADRLAVGRLSCSSRCALGSLQVLGEARHRPRLPGVPVESLILPAVAAFAVLGAIRLVPIGLCPRAGARRWRLAHRPASSRPRLAILAAASGPSAADRTAILVEVLVVAFLAFTGIAALVPGRPAGARTVAASRRPAAAGRSLAAADALVAFLLGYRAAALRSSNVRDVAWFGLTSATSSRSPRSPCGRWRSRGCSGPALLVLVFFLWDAVHGTPPVRRRDRRRIWETVAPRRSSASSSSPGAVRRPDA